MTNRELLIAFAKYAYYEKDFDLSDTTIDSFLSSHQDTEGWVKVSERLPELGEEVLVCTTGGVMALTHHTIKNSTTGQIHWLAYGEPYDVTGVTHWRELPPAPKD